MGEVPREGVVKEIMVGDVFLSPPWQREQNEAKVRQMAADWDDAKAGVVVCVERNDGEHEYAAIDGGHRISAKKRSQGEDAIIRALVYPASLDDVACSEMFLDLNMSTKVSTVDKFHAELTAQHKNAVGLDTALSERGLRIGHGYDKRTVNAASALIKAYNHKKDGPESVRRALDAMLDIWPVSEETWRAPLVAGFPAFFRSFPHADHSRVVKRVRATYPTAAQMSATAHARVAATTGGSGATASRGHVVAHMIVEAYDHGLSPVRKLMTSPIV